ncbi:uncharacterized protein METZ01_LOCUS425629 [marine metagenome]|uniref:Uncharacterized protein n=1 Tax=marine metagenome TaxID=408172 RepID=A0A382XQ51_9ZZZZ
MPQKKLNSINPVNSINSPLISKDSI